VDQIRYELDWSGPIIIGLKINESGLIPCGLMSQPDSFHFLSIYSKKNCHYDVLISHNYKF
jgi:hypothetical protein